MRLSPALRLFVSSLLLAVGTGAIWWILGLPLGAGLLRGGAETYLRRGFGFDEGNALRLCFAALLVCFTGQVAPSAAAKWLALGAIGAVAALLEPEHGPGATLAALLFVLSVPAVAEMGAPLRQGLAALACGVLVALAQVLDARASAGVVAGVCVDRGVFYFAPLLLLTPFLERWVLKRAGI